MASSATGLNGQSDAIRRQGKIEWVHVRHEEVAAFAAGADAHLTGEFAVCAGSCGPGNLHLINGLFDCQWSHVPVLAIAAQIPSVELGAGYFQETHPETLFKECSHYCELISGATTVVFKTKKSRVHRPRFKAVAAASAALVDIPGSATARSVNRRSLGSNDSNNFVLRTSSESDGCLLL